MSRADRQFRAHYWPLFVFGVICLTSGTLEATETTPRELQGVGVIEHLGEQIDLDLEFVDHNGNNVRLRDYFQDERPVLLTLNYYECPSLCTLQLNGLIEGLRGLTLDDEDFRIVTLSIDPREGHMLAAQKRQAYLGEVGREDLDWTFLVGQSDNIAALAEQVGFSYNYDERQDLYAHIAAIYFVSPSGQLIRYLYGLQYPPFHLKLALMEAANETIGTPFDQIILRCFHFVDGEYSVFAMGVMRVAATFSAVILGLVLMFYWRRERARKRAEVWA